MALAPVTLDTLTWADLIAASRRRIPAASRGLWTLHAPVDPGITLLELFAWLLEQRVYWMDQVPDSLTRALLKLLGVEPRPARPATTLLYMVCLASDTLQHQGICEVRLKDGIDPPVLFTTREEITLYPLVADGPGGPSHSLEPPRVGLWVGGRDRTEDFANGRAPRLLDDAGGDTRIILPLKPPKQDDPALKPPNSPASMAGVLALLFDLKVPAGIEPQWSPDATDGVPGAGTLTWSYSTTGGPVEFAPGAVDDGTNGLRRSGIVRLTIPEGWEASPGGGGYAIVLRASAAPRAVPPRLFRLVPNVVSAVHQRAPRERILDYVRQQVAHWRRLPGNVIVLPEGDRPALAGTLTLRMKERDGTKDWAAVPDLTRYGPEDRVFLLDTAAARLRFGDGLNGRLPIPVDAASVELSYRVGGGTAGNVGTNLEWEVTAPPDGVLKNVRAWNIVPGTGGRDDETLGEARDRAAGEFRETTRAVTREDFETLARRTPGAAVARAHAAVGRHPMHPTRTVPGAVTVFVVPDLPRHPDGSPDADEDPAPPLQVAPGPLPDQPMLDAVQARLDAARMVTGEVFARAPVYRAVALQLKVVTEAADPEPLRSAVTAALRRYFDPLVGGDDGNGWPFGGPVRPSSVLRVAQAAIDGNGTVGGVSVALADDPQGPQGCKDVAPGPDALVWLERVDVRFERPPAGRGGLR